MDKEANLLSALEARAKRRDDRRQFLKVAGTTSAAVATSAALSACFGGGDDSPTPSPSATPTPSPYSTPTGAIGDVDVLNFALNLEYLEAQFYSFAATGASLPLDQLNGAGTPGAVIPGKMVNFTDPVVRQYAKEIAADEAAHVKFLRTQLGNSAVAQPAIDISVGPNSAFSAAAQAAGLISAGQTFDPYANDENFLLAAYIFEDVGVTAYKGAAPLVTNKTYLEAAAGILAAEAYHAGLIRTVLYRKGLATPSLRTSADKISDARDSLDGGSDLDQGISPQGGASNIVPADSNGLAFSRTTGQVLNIAYLTKAAVMKGGFFPVGVNGRINTSAAS